MQTKWIHKMGNSAQKRWNGILQPCEIFCKKISFKITVKILWHDITFIFDIFNTNAILIINKQTVVKKNVEFSVIWRLTTHLINCLAGRSLNDRLKNCVVEVHVDCIPVVLATQWIFLAMILFYGPVRKKEMKYEINLPQWWPLTATAEYSSNVEELLNLNYDSELCHLKFCLKLTKVPVKKS